MLATIIGLILADYLLYPRLTAPAPAVYCTDSDGLWLGSKWYHGKVTDAHVAALGEMLHRRRFKYAFFHCRDIDATGKLRFREGRSARRLVDTLHAQVPEVKLIAWIGAVNSTFGGEVNLSRLAVRETMAKQARWLVESCGFDGVQWDFEPCDSGNNNLLDLLHRTRRELPPGTLLSAAAHRWWTDGYVKEVASRCDQFALMSYDTMLWLPRLYAGAMKDMTIRFSRLIASTGSTCKLIIGVPTYEDVTFFHHAPAENLKVALIGIKDGLARPDCNRSAIEGIAPYAEFTTDQSEWSDYDRYWLGR